MLGELDGPDCDFAMDVNCEWKDLSNEGLDMASSTLDEVQRMYDENNGEDWYYVDFDDVERQIDSVTDWVNN